jgi:hypothetical protein
MAGLRCHERRVATEAHLLARADDRPPAVFYGRDLVARLRAGAQTGARPGAAARLPASECRLTHLEGRRSLLPAQVGHYL